MSYGGVERLLHDFLAAAFPTARVCTELPADLAAVAPVIQVTRIGGPSSDDNPYFQQPTVSVDVFTTDRLDAIDLAHKVDLALRTSLPGQTVQGGTVGLVRTLSGASWRPWDDLAVRRYGASYQLWIKATTAA